MDTNQEHHLLSKEEAISVFMRQIGYVRSVAFRCTFDKSLLEDIVHDSFIYFIERAEEWICSEQTIRPLLRTIVKGMIGRHWDHYKKNLPDHLSKIAEYIIQNTGPDDDLSRTCDQLEEKLLALDICLQKLPPESRELIEMLYLDEKSYKALIKKTGKSPDAVYKQISRIRSLLHQCIKKTMMLEISDVK
ncbi:MAG: sigma-70 family RNA polymerase sigma factor [Planctomycetia bacterium]|nr:sigma-70 family RNA polymerase sigma factor [Planctomycetia bacterium]